MSLEAIGLTSLFGIPWTLKFLWAPLVDSVETKKKWLLFMQAILVALFFLIAVISPFKFALPIIIILFSISSLFSATHDIAIDGYYMETLSEKEQAKFVGFRVFAYRIAMVAGSGLIVTIGAYFSWFLAFATSAVIFLGP